jgi:hypothetical protein
MSERGKHIRTPYDKFQKTNAYALVFFGYVMGVNDTDKSNESIYKRANDFINMHPEADLNQEAVLAAYNRLLHLSIEIKKSK